MEEEEEQLPPQHRPHSPTGPLIKHRQRNGSGMEIYLSYLFMFLHWVVDVVFMVDGKEEPHIAIPSNAVWIPNIQSLSAHTPTLVLHNTRQKVYDYENPTHWCKTRAR